jgi:hypothetical protein
VWLVPRRLLLAVLAAVALAAAAAPSRAATIDGDRMDVIADPDGSIDARLAGSTSDSLLFGGLTIGFPTTAANPAELDGVVVEFGTFATVSEGAVTGTGSAGDPFTQRTTMRSSAENAAGVTVAQTVTYVNGQDSFGVRQDVTVDGGAPLNFRVTEAGDVFNGISDDGVGRLDPGPPRATLGANPAPNGGNGGIVEVTPWSHYFAGDSSAAEDLWSAPDGPGFADTVDTGPVDDAVGVQFDQYATGAGLAPGQTATFELRWRFVAGDVDFDGVIDGADNCPLVANPGQEDSNDDGVADACDPDGDGVETDFDNCPTVANEDQEDLDDDGIGDACDPSVDVDEDCFDECEPGSAGGPPVAGKRVTVRLVSGKVRIRPPGSERFKALAGKTSTRVGTLVDATKGAVRITSAAGGGRTQTGTFSGGSFRIKQPKARPLTTDLVLSGPSFAERCKAAHKRVVRRLEGVAKGRFRVVGRRSEALLKGRGTWTTQDRCDGTRTIVTKGRVAVHDLAVRGSVVVRAGHHYLALKQKRGSV